MGVLKLKDGNNWTSIQTIKGDKGDTGERGQAGVGVPSGGTTGQVLKKASGTDYDTEWGNAGSGLPSGGTQGQVLTKNSSTDGDADWSDPVISDVQVNGASVVSSGVADVPHAKIIYATTDTAAATATKVLTCDWYPETLEDGTLLLLYSSVTNTATMPSFQFYNSNESYRVYFSGGTLNSANLDMGGTAGRIIPYVFRRVSESFAMWNCLLNEATSSFYGLLKPKLFEKITTYTNILFGTCSTESATETKEITINYPKMVNIGAGTILFIQFTNSNTATSTSFKIQHYTWDTATQTALTHVVKLDNTALDASTAKYGGVANRIGVYVQYDSAWHWVGWSYEADASATADTIVYDNTETYSSGSIGEAVKNIESDVETLKDGMTFIKYGISTWDDFITAYNNNNVVYCRASSNSNPASGSQTRLAFMAYVNNAETPTEVEFQYYRSVSSHTASQQGDQVFVYKLTKTAGWTVTTRECSAKIVAGTGLTSTYSNGVLTISLA